MRHVFALFLILPTLFSCGEKKAQREAGGASVGVRYAKNFRLIAHDGFTELQLVRPETGQTEIAYALASRASKAKIPAGMTKISVPVKNIAALSSTHIGMLSALGRLNVIGGTTDEKFISEKSILRGIRSGKIAVFPDETTISPARLVHEDIDVVIYSGFGGDFPNNAKLAKLGIVTMANYDWREQDPLGKAEWIKVFGYLTGTQEQADAYFAKVEKAYKELRNSIPKEQNAPKVIAGSLIGDVWYAPAGQSYMARLLSDAGADYIYRNEQGTGSCEKSFAQVLRDQQSCSLWINPGVSTLSGLTGQNSKYALFTAMKGGKVYCYTANSDYFWEASAANPHWLLSDLSAIIRNDHSRRLHFYAQLK